MSVDVRGRLRLTVLGCSTAVPHPATPAAGYLVDWEGTALLLDVGQGVVRRLANVLDPRQLAGVFVGHMHADHYLDLAGLRYLFPWGDTATTRLPVYLPPGGSPRLEALAAAISERPGFFDAAFVVDEYDPGGVLEVGPLRVRFHRGRHYVPAWGMSVEAPDGASLVYTGDTGPSDSMVGFAHGADILLVEAALDRASDDDPERGHLTADEAIDLARQAEARAALLVHYAPGRRAETRAPVRDGRAVDPAGGRGPDQDRPAAAAARHAWLLGPGGRERCRGGGPEAGGIGRLRRQVRRGPPERRGLSRGPEPECRTCRLVEQRDRTGGIAGCRAMDRDGGDGYRAGAGLETIGVACVQAPTTRREHAGVGRVVDQGMAEAPAPGLARDDQRRVARGARVAPGGDAPFEDDPRGPRRGT